MNAILHEYWRSSASYRVRIALKLLGVPYRSEWVDLLAGQQRSGEYLALNPQALVPTLEIDGQLMTQSLAIIEYLNETRGGELIPPDARGQMRVRALSHAIAMDIHPICNQNVANHVAELLPEQDTAKRDWMQHFISRGLRAFEALLQQDRDSAFCYGNSPTLADLCLVPQLYNARRWEVDLTGFPRILAVERQCAALPAFAASVPEAIRPA